MVTEAPSTTRARRLREHRSWAVAMVAPVEVGEGGIDILIRNELLNQHRTRDRKAVAEACLAALEQWSEGQSGRDRVAVNKLGGLRTRSGSLSNQSRSSSQAYKIGATSKNTSVARGRG